MERDERESETQALQKHVGGLRGHRWTIGQLDKLWRSAQMEFAVASIIVAYVRMKGHRYWGNIGATGSGLGDNSANLLVEQLKLHKCEALA